MRKNVVFIFCFFTIQFLASQTFSFKYEDIQRIKRKIASSESENYNEAYNLLIEVADSVRNSRYFPRVTSKKITDVTADIHDYVSMATYWWPDTTKNNKVPYIRKDGVVNLEVKVITDNYNLVRFCRSIKILGLAYFYSGDEKYAKKGGEMLRTWFIHPETKMNPNLQHAQFIKGVNNGRIEGIVDARFFIDMIDGLQLMKKSRYITDDNVLKIEEWFKTFLNWMETSEQGRQGMSLNNNIGTSYHLQRLVYHAFINDSIAINKIYENSLLRLLKKQFRKDGSQPLELKRTLPLGYSIANLEYWVKISNLLESFEININKFEGDIRPTILNAYKYLTASFENNSVAFSSILLSRYFANVDVRESNKESQNANLNINQDDVKINLSRKNVATFLTIIK
ncbi:alginate lyase family protein [Zhouia spongiae]|uniref:Alginate lyase family protein n=1 Tax=Zhouia spongiae TaxID=2202721 RepID=A0ABY3YJV8_9FLAO|nr:alginate lyase family protein [Zhouia spongiae]UNY97884.1 alginate lyase family protein [Zhouia spongiae]